MELTIKDVAERLNMPAETVHRWIRQGKIPMQHRYGKYVIRQPVLEHWAQTHNLTIHARPQFAETANEAEFDGILPAVQRGGVFYDLPGSDKAAVLAAAVEQIPHLGSSERALVYEKLIEREQLGSTGIGHGIALPHPRSNPGIVLAAPQITVCFLSRPIPFEAVDREPVSLLLLLLSNSTQQHLSMLSALAYHLRDKTLRDFLLSVPSPTDFFKKIEALEPQDG